MQCGVRTEGRSHSAFIRPRQCARKAVYTDGVNFFCTQHAKEAPTVFKQASGAIRRELRRIEELK
jgi:hypothetical protein